MKLKIFIALIIIFVGIQFVPVEKNNPEINAADTFSANVSVPSEVTDILNIACMDCHSNTTQYPWYSGIAPGSWLMSKHIKNGREHLNFSEWMTYSVADRAHAAEEITEVVGSKEMPMLTYWMIHLDAKLGDEQRTVLVEYFTTLK